MSCAVKSEIEVSHDAFLGGQVKLLQPKSGHRAGMDAVLLAASVRASGIAEEALLDVGAGPGTIGLLVAHRVKSLQVTCVEIEGQLVELAKENLVGNGLEGRVKTVQADICQPFGALEKIGFVANTYDQVISNPPFYDEDQYRVSDNELKRQANSIAPGGLERWVKFMTTCARADGQISIVYPADRLDGLLKLMVGRFGGLEIFPIFPRSGEVANRVILRGRKGSRAPLQIYRGLVMHEIDGAFTTGAKEILNGGAALDFGMV